MIQYIQMETNKRKKGNELFKNVIKRLEDKAPEGNREFAEITYDELKDALDEIAKDLVYNYLIFEKEVSFDIFLSNLKIYLYIIKNRL